MAKSIRDNRFSFSLSLDDHLDNVIYMTHNATQPLVEMGCFETKRSARNFQSLDAGDIPCGSS